MHPAIPSLRVPRNGEIDHHDGVFLHNSDEQNNSDESDDAEFCMEINIARIAPTPAEGNVERIVIGECSSHRECQDDIHRGDGGENQLWLVVSEVLKACAVP